MAAVTICSDFAAQKINSVTVYPSICHEVMGQDAMILLLWMLSFKPTFSLSSFTFIKRLFNSLLSVISVVSSAYLRLLIFLPAILIPACASSSPAFLMMYSAYKLIKQGDNNIQPLDGQEQSVTAQGLPRWPRGKESAYQFRRHKRQGLEPWVGKIPWRRKWQPTPLFLPVESHGQRSLVSYNPWSHRVRHNSAWTHPHPWDRVQTRRLRCPRICKISALCRGKKVGGRTRIVCFGQGQIFSPKAAVVQPKSSKSGNPTLKLGLSICLSGKS